MVTNQTQPEQRLWKGHDFFEVISMYHMWEHIVSIKVGICVLYYYSDYPVFVLNCVSAADPQSLNLWWLVSISVPLKWQLAIKGKLICPGKANH